MSKCPRKIRSSSEKKILVCVPETSFFVYNQKAAGQFGAVHSRKVRCCAGIWGAHDIVPCPTAWEWVLGTSAFCSLTHTSKHGVAFCCESIQYNTAQHTSMRVTVTPCVKNGASGHLLTVGLLVLAVAEGPEPCQVLSHHMLLRQEILTNPRDSAVFKIKGCSVELVRETML